MSNAHRAHECRPKAGESNIRDELDEVISLNSVSLIVGEYIPSGANQIVQMNMNLGSMERVQGGYYSAKIDRDMTGTYCSSAVFERSFRARSARISFIVSLSLILIEMHTRTQTQIR